MVLHRQRGAYGHTGTITGVRAAALAAASALQGAAILYNGSGFSSGSDLVSATRGLLDRY